MTSRTDLLAALRAHQPFDQREAAMLRLTRAFVQDNPDCFHRTLRAGHITASAWVVNPRRSHALLVHHARLNKWLQPGGHCDGSPDVLAAALREALEETGLSASPITTSIFDVDAHLIPARKREPAHIHYDVRFFVQAVRSRRPVVSPESRDVRWVPLLDVHTLNTDESVLRLVAKTLLRQPLP